MGTCIFAQEKKIAQLFDIFHGEIMANKSSFTGDLKNCSTTMSHSNPKSNNHPAFW